jgi:predicted TIM-barrel fold metal-dependent hydrolase
MIMALERLDRAHETHVQYNPRGELAPRGDESFAEYLRKHIREGRIYVGCEGDEPSIAHAIQLLGPEPWVYSSDFPHEVNNDTCKEEIEEFMENEELSQREKEAVMHGNAERFYALKVPAAV